KLVVQSPDAQRSCGDPKPDMARLIVQLEDALGSRSCVQVSFVYDCNAFPTGAVNLPFLLGQDSAAFGRQRGNLDRLRSSFVRPFGCSDSVVNAVFVQDAYELLD